MAVRAGNTGPESGWSTMSNAAGHGRHTTPTVRRARPNILDYLATHVWPWLLICAVGNFVISYVLPILVSGFWGYGVAVASVIGWTGVVVAGELRCERAWTARRHGPAMRAAGIEDASAARLYGETMRADPVDERYDEWKTILGTTERYVWSGK